MHATTILAVLTWAATGSLRVHAAVLTPTAAVQALHQPAEQASKEAGVAKRSSSLWSSPEDASDASEYEPLGEPPGAPQELWTEEYAERMNAPLQYYEPWKQSWEDWVDRIDETRKSDVQPPRRPYRSKSDKTDMKMEYRDRYDVAMYMARERRRDRLAAAKAVKRGGHRLEARRDRAQAKLDFRVEKFLTRAQLVKDKTVYRAWRRGYSAQLIKYEIDMWEMGLASRLKKYLAKQVKLEKKFRKKGVGYPELNPTRELLEDMLKDIYGRHDTEQEEERSDSWVEDIDRGEREEDFADRDEEEEDSSDRDEDDYDFSDRDDDRDGLAPEEVHDRWVKHGRQRAAAGLAADVTAAGQAVAVLAARADKPPKKGGDCGCGAGKKNKKNGKRDGAGVEACDCEDGIAGGRAWVA